MDGLFFSLSYFLETKFYFKKVIFQVFPNKSFVLFFNKKIITSMMKIIFLFFSLFFVVGIQSLAPAVGKSKKQTFYIVDGNNLLHAKGVPRQVDVIADKLKPTATAGDPILLVFDGRPGLTRTETAEGNFRQVQLEEGMSSDDYILEEIATIGSESKMNRVKLVTADKRLRSFALSIRPTVKQVVNPITFWKKYRPRMAGMKTTYENPQPIETN